MSLAIAEALATQLECEPTQLRPEDRFVEGPSGRRGFAEVGYDGRVEDFFDVDLRQILGNAEWLALGDYSPSIATVGELVAACDASARAEKRTGAIGRVPSQEQGKSPESE
jgi:hypothetical protein